LETGRIERKKSFTEEGIENFWKLKREVEEEHLKAVVETASTISEDDTTPVCVNLLGKRSDPLLILKCIFKIL